MPVPSTKPVAVLAARPSADEVLIRASAALFGKPLVVNVWRAVLVESIINLTLPREWSWCATDYASWDFQHADGTRLEVKQSAARQSWKSVGRTNVARFDIAARLSTWDGTIWVPAASPLRHADFYVLAYHPVTDDTADHRNPRQWVFYVVPTFRLPTMRSISLQAVQRLTGPVSCDQLAEAVESIRGRLNDADQHIDDTLHGVSGPEAAAE